MGWGGVGGVVYLLEAGHETAVGAEGQFFHHVFEGDEVFYVDVGLELEGLGGGVEVDVNT